MAQDTSAQLNNLRHDMEALQRQGESIQPRSRWNDACGREEFYYDSRAKNRLETLAEKIKANSDAQNALLGL